MTITIIVAIMEFIIVTVIVTITIFVAYNDSITMTVAITIIMTITIIINTRQAPLEKINTCKGTAERTVALTSTATSFNLQNLPNLHLLKTKHNKLGTLKL